MTFFLLMCSALPLVHRQDKEVGISHQRSHHDELFFSSCWLWLRWNGNRQSMLGTLNRAKPAPPDCCQQCHTHNNQAYSGQDIPWTVERRGDEDIDEAAYECHRGADDGCPANPARMATLDQQLNSKHHQDDGGQPFRFFLSQKLHRLYPSSIASSCQHGT